MKLLFCPACSDVVKLRQEEMRSCFCGESFGRYTDELNSVYGGKAIPLGFSNPSLLEALQERDRMIHDGNEATQPMGVTFEAFLMPTGASSIKMLEEVKPLWKQRIPSLEERMQDVIDYAYSKSQTSV